MDLKQVYQHTCKKEADKKKKEKKNQHCTTALSIIQWKMATS